MPAAAMIDHPPVLLNEVLDLLMVRPGGIYVDCTVGLGGHSREIARRMQPGGKLLAIDRDQDALEMARENLEDVGTGISFHRDNFKNLPLILHNLGISRIDGCLADLGVSRFQLTEPSRGFTFKEEGPLDMRMDRSQKTTAENLVNQLSAEELTRLFRKLGEEPQAPKIARAIVERRRAARIRTTRELADLVVQVKGRVRRSSIHPATLVFQALRIEVNQELEGLGNFLGAAIEHLAHGSRLVVISFHSLEDRIVKKTFQLEAGRCICFQPGDLCRCPRIKRVEILTRKPMEASPAEVEANPSARSAKLRAAERCSESPSRGEES